LNQKSKIKNPLQSFYQGNENGFDYIFKEYYPPLTYFAQSLLKNKESAEDVVEDCFIKLWERRDLLKTGIAIKAYLYSTVRNASIDILRREKRKTICLDRAKETIEREEKPIIHHIIEAESMNQIFTAIECLPSKCREVFKLFYLEGKSLKEIAEELSIATTTVISQKKRALQILRNNLPPREFLLILIYFSIN